MPPEVVELMPKPRPIQLELPAEIAQWCADVSERTKIPLEVVRGMVRDRALEAAMLHIADQGVPSIVMAAVTASLAPVLAPDGGEP